MRVLLFAALVPVVLAQAPVPMDVLEQARGILAERAKHLPITRVCRPSIASTSSAGTRISICQIVPAPKSWRQTSVARDLVLWSTDRLRLDVKVSQGNEIGVWAGAREFGSASVFDLIGGGPYGTGMLRTLIGDIFENRGAAYRYSPENDGYSFQVPLAASHYHVRTYSGWMTTAFSGEFWVDAKAVELRRLKVRVSDLPPQTGACEVVTTVDYAKTRVGNGEFLRPRKSVIHGVLRDESETESRAVYTGCRQYLRESTIRFDDGEAGRPAQPANGPAARVPPNIPFEVALLSAIDTNRAAAGDAITAKLRKLLRMRHQILAPAGALVRGRIIQMRHWTHWPAHYVIAIRLESLKLNGAVAPLYAMPTGKAASMERMASFTFMTNRSRYVVHAGFSSDYSGSAARRASRITIQYGMLWMCWRSPISKWIPPFPYIASFLSTIAG